jgi:hypothetical protein
VERLESHLRSIQTRIGLSIAIYVVFMIAAVVLGIQGRTLDDDRMLLWMVPLVSAVLVLPRSTMLSRWPTADDDDEAARIEMARTTLRAWNGRVIVMRFGYIVVAGALLAVLPMLGV